MSSGGLARFSQKPKNKKDTKVPSESEFTARDEGAGDRGPSASVSRLLSLGTWQNSGSQPSDGGFDTFDQSAWTDGGDRSASFLEGCADLTTDQKNTGGTPKSSGIPLFAQRRFGLPTESTANAGAAGIVATANGLASTVDRNSSDSSASTMSGPSAFQKKSELVDPFRGISSYSQEPTHYVPMKEGTVVSKVSTGASGHTTEHYLSDFMADKSNDYRILTNADCVSLSHESKVAPPETNEGKLGHLQRYNSYPYDISTQEHLLHKGMAIDHRAEEEHLNAPANVQHPGQPGDWPPDSYITADNTTVQPDSYMTPLAAATHPHRYMLTSAAEQHIENTAITASSNETGHRMMLTEEANTPGAANDSLDVVTPGISLYEPHCVEDTTMTVQDQSWDDTQNQPRNNDKETFDTMLSSLKDLLRDFEDNHSHYSQDVLKMHVCLDTVHAEMLQSQMNMIDFVERMDHIHAVALDVALECSKDI